MSVLEYAPGLTLRPGICEKGKSFASCMDWVMDDDSYISKNWICHHHDSHYACACAVVTGWVFKFAIAYPSTYRRRIFAASAGF